MTTNTGADPNAKADGSNQGAAPPGSQGDGGKGSGEEMIPRSRFVAALNDVTRRLDAQAAENQQLKAQIDAVQKPGPKIPTQVELDALVASGDLTKGQADEIMRKQIVDEATVKATAEANRTVSAATHAAAVNAQLASYKEFVGPAWEVGTPENEKVVAEFGHLVNLGLPNSLETQVAALRSVFGDIDTLRASKTARPGSSDTHAETGGGKPNGKAPSADGTPRDLTAREKEYYTRLIHQGVYKDWGEVTAERAAVPARRRAR